MPSDRVEDADLREWVVEARGGDRNALERLARAVQDDVFQLALRMLGNPEDAMEATQETLVRVITGLQSFRGQSQFRTWVHSVAANTTLNYRESLRRREASFEELSVALHAAQPPSHVKTPDPESDLVLAEAKEICLQGMLLCLDRPHRLAYVLGEILELSTEEGAAISEIEAPAFRKRLERAREKMEAFLSSHCGIAQPTNPCRCARLLPGAIQAGIVQPDRLLSGLRRTTPDRLPIDLDTPRSAAEIYRSLARYAAPEDFAHWLHEATSRFGPPHN
jgi:RNA polymerase sigma factor (sigma-70 family)